MQIESLSQKIEAILFYTAEAVSIRELAKILATSEEEIENGITTLESELKNRGVRLVRHDGDVLLSTAPEYSELIDTMIKEERQRDLGRAGIETLSIIAYKGPVSKKEIEFIRGVNSDYALRSLLLRGLVEQSQNETDGRSTVYTITADALLHLGLSRIEDLPEYTQVRTELAVVDTEIKNEDSE